MDLPNELLHYILLKLPGLQVPRLRVVSRLAVHRGQHSSFEGF
jgi:hypothetical protein